MRSRRSTDVPAGVLTHASTQVEASNHVHIADRDGASSAGVLQCCLTYPLAEQDVVKIDRKLESERRLVAFAGHVTSIAHGYSEPQVSPGRDPLTSARSGKCLSAYAKVRSFANVASWGNSRLSKR